MKPGRIMNIKVKKTGLDVAKCSVLILGCFENAHGLNLRKNENVTGFCQPYFDSKDFCGKKGESLLLYTNGQLKAQRLLLLGLGSLDDFSLLQLKQTIGAGAKQVTAKNLEEISVGLESFLTEKASATDVVKSIVEGISIGTYAYEKYINKKKSVNLREVTIFVPSELPEKDLRKTAQQSKIIAEAVNFTRDLQNHPGNWLTPTRLANISKKVCKELGLKCKVLEKPDISKLKMGALLGVAQGSKQPPKVIVLEHRPEKIKTTGKPIVFVGKGVTFDSGGISLKPAASMEEMKFDMSGAAAVLGAMKAVAQIKLPVHVVGIIPTVENLPSGSSMKPGDILTASSGTTIEVVNTDAEGRLILADALAYAKKFKPQVVIDLATLTGACVVAFGHRVSGMMGNDQPLMDDVKAAGEVSGDRVWQLPLWDDYYEDIKSDYADIKNSGGRWGGAITAAAFLGTFTKDFSWAHIDIAGTAWNEEKTDYLPKGGTGVGVRLLVEYLLAKVN